MENITTLTPSMGFDSPHEGEVESLIPIQPQGEGMAVESMVPSSGAMLLAARPEDPVGGEGRELVPTAGGLEASAGPSGDSEEPRLGMEFDSPDAARAFFSAYAERVGFRIRNSKSFTSRVDDTVIMRRFVCSKQGRPTKKDPFDLTKKRRNRASSREGCKAMLQVNRRENGLWAVSRCALEHCHPLGIAPKASPAVQKKLAKKPWELLVSPPTETQQSGLGPGGGVAQSLLEYFKRMQAENPAFFYAIQVDQNNCVANVFWADARARMAYGYFGDAIMFDMTCKKNKRVVPFAAFTGVNHHRQLIVFGCAFMTDESEASFTWLFETWLALMSGRRPVSITTAYNDAMGAASTKVFLNVRHRFCRRDIFHKCKEKLSNVYLAHPSFKAEFKKCVSDSENIEEFESCWKLIMDRYNLKENMWLQSLYDIRQKWVPAYARSTFFAELSGAPKLETMHKFFQRHSITTTSLRDLVTQFDKAMAGQYEKEIQADFATTHNRPVLKTPSPLEKQASEIYTKTIFDLLQEELVESSGFLMDKIEDGVVSKFRVTKVDDASKVYMVNYNASEKSISCSCCKFEFSGILCRHAFRVSVVVGILTFPEGYILRRWTRNAKSSILSYDHCGVLQTNCHKAVTWRCNDLCRDAIRFAEEGATSAVIYKVAKGALQKAFAEVFAAKRGSSFNGTR
uniref:Protein FAR1-RELATED SEQUENCE n=1 Tax=Elaeis guineensis var. tenera TaxID=51953 RepID=A0A6I9RPP6_ELAGV|nr:protein FAR1-RELATED SEQUENCE 5 [Elaeis guineensis]XP_029122440.1 protein FAR1-RELATED SEQUENCE 5 [Elaeis guineensis]